MLSSARPRLLLYLCLPWGLAVENPSQSCGAGTCADERPSGVLPSEQGRSGADSSEVPQNDIQAWLCGFGPDGAELRLCYVTLLDVQQVLNHSCGFVNTSSPVRFALVRTHKTGSTTVSQAMIRSGMWLGLRWAGCGDRSRFVPHEHACNARNDSTRSQKHEGKYDFESRHTYDRDTWWTSEPYLEECDADGRHFERTLQGYEKQMGSDVQIFALIREAHSHLRSTLDFYQVPFAKFNASESLWNPLAKDFRLLQAEHVDEFLARWPFNRRGRLHVLVTEELAASMVMFRRTVNWSLRDVVFLSGRVTKRHGWVPEPASMPPGRLNWDERLNEVLRPLFMVELAKHQSDPSFQREVTALNRINAVLPQVCAQPQEGFVASVCDAKVENMKDGKKWAAKYRKFHCG
ncbi:ftsH [Symbiodinium natans]|uniref:FtsH protein n=1 Tax=Symbiodinium natans TaxID=878477 RepID=A0A812KD75_9DINO|nr:ftsH [Symbiodinium natans]